MGQFPQKIASLRREAEWWTVRSPVLAPYKDVYHNHQHKQQQSIYIFSIIWQKNCVYISDKKMKLRLFSVAITSCYFVINHEWSTIQCQTALRTIIYCLLCIIRSLIFHNDEIQQSIPQSQSEPGLANQQVRPDQLDPRLFYPCWSCGAVELWSWGAGELLPFYHQPVNQQPACGEETRAEVSSE